MTHIILNVDELEKLQRYSGDSIYGDRHNDYLIADSYGKAILLNDLRALIANSAKADDVVKDGYVLVPIEPTVDMIRALMNGWETDGSKPMRDNYKAMIDEAMKASKE